MRRVAISMLIVCFCMIGCAKRTAPEEIEEYPQLVNIKKLYITSLGNEEGSGIVRETIRLRLLKSTRFSVVEAPERADAVLTGVAGVLRSYYGREGKLDTRSQGMAVLRLVNVKNSETIWTFEYSRGFGGGGSTDRIADQIVEKLLRDARRADDKR